eukprot:TRINITY_DN7314_c0_g1_i1.p1 TRINITY_DN7314_c0_g1~~TRINITY_DN7314_c0_g1_i1.p1  ORF type:complete len:111 (-),score=19.05 TRINITY_DN7314_c0_g1_i1:389-721(-)
MKRKRVLELRKQGKTTVSSKNIASSTNTTSNVTRRKSIDDSPSKKQRKREQDSLFEALCDEVPIEEPIVESKEPEIKVSSEDLHRADEVVGTNSQDSLLKMMISVNQHNK